MPFLLESVEKSLYKARFLIDAALEEAEPLCVEVGVAQVLGKLQRIIETMLEFITTLQMLIVKIGLAEIDARQFSSTEHHD